MASDLEEYGNAVLSNTITACDKIKVEYERLLSDIEHPHRWHFDEKRALRPIAFIENFCRQSQGKAMGKPLRLEQFQKAMLEATFGFVDDEGLRRYQEVINIIGRKNGKTTLLAAIQLYMLLADGEGAPECYQIATAKEQAMKGYRECCNMRLHSPALSRHVKKRQGDLYCAENLGFIKALASDTDHLDSLNSSCVVIDELAAVKNRDIYDLMKQSMSARAQPILFEISTNGFVRNSIFDSQYEYAAGVLDGSIKDDRLLPIIYELDDRTEWTERDKWIKANPGLGTIKSEEFLADCVKKAEHDDSFRPTVLVKDFNLIENSNSAWLTWDDLNNENTYPDDLHLRYGIGGMDAADSVDLNAAKLIGMRRDDPRIYVYSMYWIPAKKLEEAHDRMMPDGVPYDKWAARDLIRIVPGNRVNKRVFLDWFIEMRDEHDIYPLYIAYDPWHIDDSLLAQFENEFGKNVMIGVRQGVATLSQPMKDLKAEFQAHNIVYNNNPIDKWCFANTYVRTDINGNIQPSKETTASSSKRIDGLASLLDAYVVLKDKYDDYQSMI